MRQKVFLNEVSLELDRKAVLMKNAEQICRDYIHTGEPESS